MAESERAVSESAEPAPPAKPPAEMNAAKLAPDSRRQAEKTRPAPERWQGKPVTAPPPKTQEKQESRAEGAPQLQEREAAEERHIGQLDAPHYASFVPPEYPPRARRRNLEGRVLLRVLINSKGRAEEIQVVESSHPEFVSAARRSAKKSRYVPQKRNGLPEEVWVLIPFHFKLR